MARMLGKFERPYCRQCRTESGPDCPDYSRAKRSQKALEERQWRKEWPTDLRLRGWAKDGSHVQSS